MSAAHTPGPYGVFADERSIKVCTADGATCLARIANGDNELDNAHLFAAAPDLLEALQNALAAGLPEAVASAARAAIAKATGQEGGAL